jgi:hypothetical protein
LKITSGNAWLGLERAQEGMKRNGAAMESAAGSVVSRSVAVLNGSAVQPVDRVSIRGEAGLDEAMIDLKTASHGFSANARVARVSDEAFQSMLDMCLPHGSRRD